MRVEWIFKEGEWHRGPWEIGHRDKILFIDKTSWAPKNTIALPGFINLHSHLELSSVDGELARGYGFSKWVQYLRRETERWKNEDYLASVKCGLFQLAASGVTTVLDVGNTSANWQAGKTAKIRFMAQRELIGLDPNVAEARWMSALTELENYHETLFFKPLITGHAPFSTSPELLDKIAQWRAQKNEPLALNLHMSESNEEQDFFRYKGGALRDFAESIYPDLVHLEAFKSSTQYTLKKRPSFKNELWVHANTISNDELAVLRQHKISLVHCPRSRDYFNHPKPDLKAWDDNEIKWGFGTDSKASNENLNFWSELEFFYKQNNYSSEAILTKATQESALILGRSNIGVLEKEASADIQVLQLIEGTTPKDVFEKRPKVLEVMCRGRRCFKGYEL